MAEKQKEPLEQADVLDQTRLRPHGIGYGHLNVFSSYFLFRNILYSSVSVTCSILASASCAALAMVLTVLQVLERYSLDMIAI